MPASVASQLCIVVSSCDRYSACWSPFEHGLRKYWPDCPYPAYLITNEREFVSDRLHTMRIGEDRGWALNLIALLQGMESPYVLYLQEDYWFSGRVDTGRIGQYLEGMERWGADYLRLAAVPGPDLDFADDPRLGALSPDAAFRTSLQPAIWRREALLALLKPGESAWAFETDGSVRSRDRSGAFLCVRPIGKDAFAHGIRYVCTAIHGGRWTRAALAYARTERIKVEFAAFPGVTRWEAVQARNRLAALVGRWTGRVVRFARDPHVAVGKLRHRLSTDGSTSNMQRG